MKIRYKIVIQFSLIVAFNLLIFSEFIYYRAEVKRQNNFYERLSRRASTTAKLLVDVKGFSPELLRIMDENSLNRLNGEEIFVFNTKNKLLYSNTKRTPKAINLALLDKIKMQNFIQFTVNNREYIGLLFDGKFDNFVVIESAIDNAGEYDLKTLRQTLLIGFLINILIVIISGIFFAGQALQPIKTINYQIDQITAQNLRKRVDEGKNHDEITELAHNFNQMLKRLELGFEQQQSFVSHASHELRTPLSAIKSEIQLGLYEKLSVEEYEQVLKNILEDTDRLIALSNGLLQMARPIDTVNHSKTENIRIEELILSAQNELKNSRANASIKINFAKMPSDESLTIVKGNSTLLKNAFLNLLDNAVKYSSNKPVEVLIDFDNKDCIIQIIDKGIGIASDELPNIFLPFYRSENTLDIQGFGIGLSICHKIIDLHKGRITVTSQLGSGSVFTIYLPHVSL